MITFIKMDTVKYYLLFCIPLLLVTCEKSRDWELESLAEPTLVIEAILTNQDTVQEIRLTQSYVDLNGEAPPITNAVVSVEANDVTYAFATDPQRPGYYLSQVPFMVVSQLNYKLRVDWEGNAYTASSRLSEVTPIPAVSFAPFGNTDSLLQLSSIIPPYDNDQQSMYEITADWSHMNTAEPNRAKFFLYTFSEVHVSQFVPPAREKVSFPVGSKVTIVKYGLNHDFAAYLHARAIETDWNSNFFYGTAENPPTNISNGGLGFFSTCAILRETVIAE